MPSSATITAFYNFSPNTKARASHVQNNFDVFRGHLLPVHPSTATSADNTYDLGSTEHRWRTLFSANAKCDEYLIGQTTTGWKISQTTSGSGGSIEFRNNNSLFFKVASSSINETNTVSEGGYATNRLTDYFYTATANVAGSTCTISTTGRPVFIGLTALSTETGTAGYMQSDYDLSGPTVILTKNGTHISRLGGYDVHVPSSSFWFLDFAAAGTHTYALKMSNTQLYSTRIVVFEL